VKSVDEIISTTISEYNEVCKRLSTSQFWFIYISLFFLF
jgi:hypothetical protein